MGRLVLDQGSVSDTQRKKVSREGLALIKSLEGLRSKACRLIDGRWVIGYGHTASAREGARIGDAEAELLLQYDLLPIVAALNQTLTRPVNQHQFDALASYGLSVGAQRLRQSAVLQAINDGRLAAAAAAIAADDEAPASAPPPPMVQRRRGAEHALFTSDPKMTIRLTDLLIAPLPFGDVAGVSEDEAPGVADVEPEPIEALAPFPKPEDAAPEVSPRAQLDAAVAEPARNPRSEAVAALLAESPLETGSPAVAESMAGDHLTLTRSADDGAMTVDAVAQDAGPGEFAPGQPLAPQIAAVEAPVTTAVQEPQVAAAGAANAFARRAEEDALTLSRPRPGIVRHAVDPASEGRTKVVESLAFIGLGGLGFLTFGAAIGAFRLAADRDLMGDQTRLIAWTLTLIAAACVGVAAYQLHRRYGADALPPKDDKPTG